ncbi:hypothetical protein FC093_17200 [Ilyomonas limi]|uniref:Uncharacterized protein n=1 Tax=Ilyomonas limi TaxID=2575867 RepID=A0A4U3KV31_9BACT|nr:hypothetical protein [Ilyomonas limi]TKK66321.1 hypothetical protein FC093_17200 [Ilyomonas limi]
MKKIALILLILIYAISTFGVGLKEFYCCGKLTSISISLVDTGKDKCKKGDSKDDCCKSKYQFLQVKDKHFASVHPSLPLKYSIALVPTNLSFHTVSLLPKKIDVINGSHAPPIISAVPIYITNCAFRI